MRPAQRAQSLTFVKVRLVPLRVKLYLHELDVFRLLATGKSNAEIADELVVAETTVKTHVTRVLSQARGARPSTGRCSRVRDGAREPQGERRLITTDAAAPACSWWPDQRGCS